MSPGRSVQDATAQKDTTTWFCINNILHLIIFAGTSTVKWLGWYETWPLLRHSRVLKIITPFFVWIVKSGEPKIALWGTKIYQHHTRASKTSWHCEWTLILEPHAYYAKLKGLMPWHPKRWIVTATYEWQAELSAFLIFQYFWDQSFRALHQTLSAISIQLEKILEFWRLLTPGNLIWKLGLEHPTYKWLVTDTQWARCLVRIRLHFTITILSRVLQSNLGWLLLIDETKIHSKFCVVRLHHSSLCTFQHLWHFSVWLNSQDTSDESIRQCKV